MSDFSSQLSRRRVMGWLSLALGSTCLPAWAGPDLERSIYPSIADRGHPDYHFDRLQVDSTDMQRHYSFWIATPRRAPPPEGHPIIYLLDGNAALDDTPAWLLNRMAAATPPVIVYLGYATDKRFDVRARQEDYTPSLPQQGIFQSHGRPSGGVETFIATLVGTWLPMIERAVPINSMNRYFWGHSYGGLCVLYTMMTRPWLMSHFIAASPSLGWNGNQLAGMARQFSAPAGCIPALWLLRGEEEGRERPRHMRTEKQDQRISIDELAALLERQDPALSVEVEHVAGLSHGPMFTHSLHRAMARAAGLDAPAARPAVQPVT
ncbi:alpha/beta hydrolase [Larsenimonas rhizosphaerae]|uniref:alpha/beta hydrolase n=1 Tax=Larsenimonas rhizosphaerae TaxID=2944682 RepID=UPI0020336547|nr:alpha/beta hydrolase-fold protein [Larsenimonas rhizosphaerae]MCM2129958.1 alpha/beta hydrolase-fold protein [Larsenimonas rhizosphaerae]